MYTVKIRETKTNGITWTSNHRTDDAAEAINRAVKKHFGTTAFFFEDSGLRGMTRKYGQIFRPLGQNQNTSVTGKIYIDCDEAE